MIYWTGCGKGMYIIFIVRYKTWRQDMAKLEFNEKAYQEYVKNDEYPSNTRIRAECVSFMEAVIEGQEIMESTEEGREVLAHISRLGERNGE
jgi:hypothetical protein